MPSEEAQLEFSTKVQQYLRRLYAENTRAFACHATDEESFRAWQERARPALETLLGLDRIAASVGSWRPNVSLGPPQDLGAYTRRRGHIETEPGVPLPFWLLRPKAEGPFPVAVTPHGHSATGMNESIGLAADDTERAHIAKEDRDIAVQAVLRGFFTVAPTTRGLGPAGEDDVCVRDITERHGARDCRSHVMHALLAGRTAMGERVWDMRAILDWALSLDETDGQRILMVGNSGGGMVTTYAAACDPRVTVAIPSCAYSSLVGSDGVIHHCDCNVVPGILGFGEFWDVAGLIAPRALLTVNGRYDALHSTSEVDHAVGRLRAIYGAGGAAERYEHAYGEGGHRFYAHLMWPFVAKHLHLAGEGQAT